VLAEQASRQAARFLPGACGLLPDSCGNPKLSQRDADDPLKVKGKVALVQEADAERDLRQAEFGVPPQKVLPSFNATGAPWVGAGFSSEECDTLLLSQIGSVN